VNGQLRVIYLFFLWKKQTTILNYSKLGINFLLSKDSVFTNTHCVYT